MDWTRSEISDLISLYRQYDCLWNTLHEDYNNCDVKQTAWMEIASACGKDMDDVRRKVKHLRSAYVAEKKKSEASKEFGVSYMPNLFYYKDFDFLDTVVVLRKSSLPPSSTQSLLSIKNGRRNKQRKQRIVKVVRKSLRDTKINNAIDAIVASVQPHTNSATEEGNDSNVFNSFGKTTALQLQQLPLDKATEAMSAIYQLIAKKTLESLRKTQTDSNGKRRNGVISFETMNP